LRTRMRKVIWRVIGR